jgi:hypothetical protein
MSNEIKWIPGELFAWMDHEQLRAILTEVERRDPELIKDILTERGYKLFCVNGGKALVDDKKS